MVRESSWWSRGIRGWLGALAGLVYPQHCIGCGRWNSSLCARCWLLSQSAPQLLAIDDAAGVPWLPVWALGRYDGPLRQIVLGAKHDWGVNVEDFLFQSAANLGQQLATNLESHDGPIWVVASPSSWRRRWDHHDVTGPLARGVAAALRAELQRENIEIKEAIGLRWGRKGQGGRSRDERAQGRRGAFRLLLVPPPNVAVVIVDDVVTTGATVREVARCLGSSVQAVAVLASA